LNLVDVLREYVDYVGLERNGYLSMQLPIGDRLSVSLRLGSQ